MDADCHVPLREALRCAVEARGLRGVAREAAINAQSLANFLSRATRPLPETVEKLRRWELRLRLGWSAGERPDREMVQTALAALTAAIEPARRPGASRCLMAALREQWRAAGVPIPPWAEEPPLLPEPQGR